MVGWTKREREREILTLRSENEEENEAGISPWKVWRREREREEEEKTIRRKEEEEEEERWRRKGAREREDRHWRWSNNGLLTMIIEHEAAGTLLKSTESRAGGFTCRINFYLVSSLPVPFSSSFSFVSHCTPFVCSPSSSFTPRYTPTGFPLVTDYFFHQIGENTHLSFPLDILLLSFPSTMKFAFYKDKFNISP